MARIIDHATLKVSIVYNGIFVGGIIITWPELQNYHGTLNVSIVYNCIFVVGIIIILPDL